MCIYVSLNGISNKDEVDKAIFFECVNNKLRLEKNSTVKKIKEVSKPLVSLGKTIAKVTGKFDDIKFEYEEFTNLENCVLCFDDLERVNMPIEKILGYINNFVEHEGIKTFIIANEQEISNKNLSDSIEAKYQVALELIKFEKDSCNKQNKKDKNNTNIQQIINKRIEELFKDNSYNRIKEKLIGRTIKYNPDLNEIIKNLISNFTAEYNKLLKNNLYLILSNSYNKNVNIRILIQTLNEFEAIYEIIKKSISNIKVKEVNVEEINEEELMKELLKFYVLISMELRLGNINSKLLKEISTRSYNEVSAGIVLYPKKIHGFESFIKKYYEKECFYIKEMVNLIVEGYLDEESLKEDINKFIIHKYPKKYIERDLEKNLTPYQILEKFRELDDADVKKNLELLKGEFKIDNNIKIILKKVALIQYLYQQKAININLKNLKSEIEELIKNKSDLEFFNIIETMQEEKADDLYYEVYLLAKERYKELLSQRLKVKFDIKKSLHEITSEIKSYCIEHGYKPIFVHVNSHDLALKVVNSSNNEINDFNYLIQSIYMSFSNIEDYYSDDRESLKVLYENISKNIKQDEYSVKNSNLMLLVSNLEKICERLDKHNKKS